MNRRGLTPGALGGILLLLLLLAALFPSFNIALDHIVANGDALTAEISRLVLPIIVVGIFATLWNVGGGR